MSYFAYLHARPNTTNVHGIFYVGKGTADRVGTIKRHNAYHQNIVRKHGVENILVGSIECSTEDIAFELERGLIKCLRRGGVKLTNQSDGGEGQSGYSHTDDTRAKMSASHKELRSTEVGRLHMSKISKSRSEATLEAISRKSLDNWANPVFRAKVVAAQTQAQRNLPITETKRNIAKANAELGREKLRDPVVKAIAAEKNSAKSKAMWDQPGFREKMREIKLRTRESKKCT